MVPSENKKLIGCIWISPQNSGSMASGFGYSSKGLVSLSIVQGTRALGKIHVNTSWILGGVSPQSGFRWVPST